MSKLSSRLAAAAGLALLLYVPAARAADLAPPPPPPPLRSEWTGIYAGGVAGGSCFLMDYTTSTGTDPELNGCTAVGGFVGGWTYQLGDHFVIGGEGDYMWGGRTAKNSLDASWYDANNISTLRGRVGWLQGNTLFYATGGVGWVWGKMGGLVGPTSIPASSSRTHEGWVIGGGIEHAFTPNLRARLEYLYGSFDTDKYNLTVSTCATSTSCIVKLHMNDMHMVRAGVTWNFGTLFW